MKQVLISIALFICSLHGYSQDTFSIVAIDLVTGELGSAGASCVGSSITYPHGAAILSDVLPGIGVIHTQAAWNSANQQYAHDLMMQGLPPAQIIDSLVANDANNNPTTRQYGIADFNSGSPRSAAYTGVNCLNYKNHITGPGYSIQGNILLGQEFLDSMEARYLNTPGALAERLMAALQGAKVLGADTRCAPRGTSSQSSFLRVGKPDDPYDTLYCELWMAYPTNYPSPYPVDPIDSLQTLFDIWKTTVGDSYEGQIMPGKARVYFSSDGELVVDLRTIRIPAGSRILFSDLSGRTILLRQLDGPMTRIHETVFRKNELYLYRIVDTSGAVLTSDKVFYTH